MGVGSAAIQLLLITDQMLRHAPAQDFGGPFGDANTAQLPVPPLERQLLHQPQASMDLNRAVDDAARRFRANNLRPVRQITHILAAIAAPGTFINHQARGVQFHRRIGDHELDHLGDPPAACRMLL